MCLGAEGKRASAIHGSSAWRFGGRMDSQIILVSFIIIIALAFDFLNGFHDAANSIATIVGTHVLSPIAAVMLAAFWNFAAAFFFETKVAATIGRTSFIPSSSILTWCCSGCSEPSSGT